MDLLEGREVLGNFLALQVLPSGLALPGLLAALTPIFSMPHSGFQTYHLALPFLLKTVTTYLSWVPEPSIIQ